MPLFFPNTAIMEAFDSRMGPMLGRVFLKEGISFKEELDGGLETERKSTFGNIVCYQKKIHHNFPSAPSMTLLTPLWTT